MSLDDYLAAMLEKQSPGGEEATASPQEQPVGPRRRHIWEIIADNMKNVPTEEFDALPKDGLQQIDHYVYGTPKRTL